MMLAVDGPLPTTLTPADLGVEASPDVDVLLQRFRPEEVDFLRGIPVPPAAPAAEVFRHYVYLLAAGGVDQVSFTTPDGAVDARAMMRKVHEWTVDQRHFGHLVFARTDAKLGVMTMYVTWVAGWSQPHPEHPRPDPDEAAAAIAAARRLLATWQAAKATHD